MTEFGANPVYIVGAAETPLGEVHDQTELSMLALAAREARANLLTLDEGDAVTGTAEYKVCAAKLEALPEGARQGAEFPGAWFRGGR